MTELFAGFIGAVLGSFIAQAYTGQIKRRTTEPFKHPLQFKKEKPLILADHERRKPKE